MRLAQSVNIVFSRKDLRAALTSEKSGKKKWGGDAKRILKMYKVLEAAECLADIQPLLSARLHQLKGKTKGKWSVSATKALRIVFEPLNDPPPVKADGSLDLARVTDIVIHYVGDYH